MSDPKVGNIIEGNAHRDAIHVAIAPVIAGQVIQPGEHIGFNRSHTKVFPGANKLIGIADPFLKERIEIGDTFWIFLYPQTITGMRHHWQHPEFQEEGSMDFPHPDDIPDYLKNEHAAWIRGWASTIPLAYDVVMDGAKDYLETGEYLCFGGLLEGIDIPDEFWEHYNALTGANGSGHFFICSC